MQVPRDGIDILTTPPLMDRNSKSHSDAESQAVQHS
jgi:hypothetical protein